MDISEKIESKERQIYYTRNIIHIFDEMGATDQAKQFQEELKDLEDSLKHYREVQKIESARSGRKKFTEDAWKYFLVFFGGMAFLKIVEFILSKF